MKIAVMLGAAALAALSSAVPGVGQAAKLLHVDPQAPCFRWPAVDMDEDGVFDRIDHCVNTKKGCLVDGYGCQVDADRDGVCDGVDRCPDTPSSAEVDAFGCPVGAAASATPPPTPPPPPAPVPASQRPMEKQLVETGRIRLENLYFESGSSRLLPESEEALREAGETLEKYPQLEIEVQGHTDTRGSARFNLKLSQSRAESVRSFLMEHFQLRSNHVVAKGYGETEPETRERNEEEMLRNRRVELRVLNPDALPRIKIEH